MKFRYYDVEMEIDPNRWVLVNWKLQHSYIVYRFDAEIRNECEVEKKKERNVIK